MSVSRKLKPFLKHKYGAKRSESGGYSFPSKLERNCWDRLKELESQGKINFVLRQIGVDLGFKKKRHFVDFLVFTEDRAIFMEAKGRDLEAGRIKRELAEKLMGVDIHLLKKESDIDKVLQQETGS